MDCKDRIITGAGKALDELLVKGEVTQTGDSVSSYNSTRRDPLGGRHLDAHSLLQPNELRKLDVIVDCRAPFVQGRAQAVTF